MITQKIQNDEEFFNPNINYQVLMSVIKKRILVLEDDIKNIKDSKIRGMAEKEMFELRKQYFDYLKVDFELQHMMKTNPDVYGLNGGEENEDI